MIIVLNLFKVRARALKVIFVCCFRDPRGLLSRERDMFRCFAAKHLGCVRLGNPDLDFENLNPDFPIEREIRKRISPPRNPYSGWISIKK